jgi:hypothetical protein
MPVKNQWLIPNKVIVSRSDGVVTKDELITSNEAIIAFIWEGYTATQQKVHVLADARKVTRQPSALEARHIFTYLEELGCGEIVVGGVGNPFLYFFAKVVGKIANMRVQVYESPEQALLALQDKDRSWPNLLEAYQQIKDGL